MVAVLVNGAHAPAFIDEHGHGLGGPFEWIRSAEVSEESPGHLDLGTGQCSGEMRGL